MSNCIYKEKNKTISNKLNSFCKGHSLQSEYIIRISPLDKIIVENKKKIKKKNNQSFFQKHYLTRLQKDMTNNKQNFSKKKNNKRMKISKNIVKTIPIIKKKITPITEKESYKIANHKNKINWNEFILERRRSRRLSNMPPINVKLEIIDEIQNTDILCDEILYSYITKEDEKITFDEITNTNYDYLQQEKYSSQFSNISYSDKLLNDLKNIKSFKIFLLNECQGENDKITKEEKKKISNNFIDNFKLFLKSPKYLMNVKCNISQTDDCYITKSSIIPEVISSLETTVYEKTCDDIVLNLKNKNINFNCNIIKNYTLLENQTHLKIKDFDKILTCFNYSNIFDFNNSYNCYHCAYINIDQNYKPMVLNRWTLNRQLFSKIKGMKVKPSMLSIFELAYTIEKQLLPKKYFNLNLMEKIPFLLNTYSDIVKNKVIQSQHESYFKYNKIVEQIPHKLYFGVNGIKKLLSQWEKKEMSLPEKYSVMNKTKYTHYLKNIFFKMLKMGVKPSQHETEIILLLSQLFFETKEIQFYCELYSKIKKYKKITSQYVINEFLSPEKYSETFKTKKIQPSQEKYSEIIETTEVLSQCETEESLLLPKTYPKLTEIPEVLPLSQSYSKLIDTTKEQSQYDVYSKIKKSEETLKKKANLSIEKYSEISETKIISKPYSEMSEIKDAIIPEVSDSEIFKKPRPPLPKTYSRKTIIEKLSSNKISKTPQLDSEIDLIYSPEIPKVFSENSSNHSSVISKSISDMVILEHKTCREKISFITSLGLLPIEKLNTMNKIKEKDATNVVPKFSSKILPRIKEDYLERKYYRTSSEKIKNSLLLEYSHGKEHPEKAILIPEKTFGISFHPERTCTHKCTICHAKFGTLDTPYHLAQIKNVDKRNEILKGLSPKLGPSSCLCATCFRSFKTQSSEKCVKKKTCTVMTCYETATQIFKSPLINKIKRMLINTSGILFRGRTKKNSILAVCDEHYNKLLMISECQLCGNQTLSHKRVVDKSKAIEFQYNLDKDQLPCTISCDFLVCDACYLYLLWRNNNLNPKDQSIDVEKHCATVLKRICLRNEIKKSMLSTENINIEKQNNSQLSKNYNERNKTVLLKNNVKQTANKFVMVSTLQKIKNKSTTVNVNRRTKSFPLILQSKNDATINDKPLPMIQPETKFINKYQQLPGKQLSSHELELVCPTIKKNINTKRLTFEPVLRPILSPDITDVHSPKSNQQEIIQPAIVNLSSSKTISSAVNRSDKEDSDNSKTANFTPNVFKIFNKLHKPYPSTVNFVDHLLTLENLRRKKQIIAIDKDKDNLLDNNGHNSVKINQMSTCNNRINHIPTLKNNQPTSQVYDDNIVDNNIATMIFHNENNNYNETIKKLELIDNHSLVKYTNDEQIKITSSSTSVTTTTGFVKIPKSITSKTIICKPQQVIDSKNIDKQVIFSTTTTTPITITSSAVTSPVVTTFANITTATNSTTITTTDVVTTTSVTANVPSNRITKTTTVPSKYMKFLSNNNIIIKKVHFNDNKCIIANSVKTDTLKLSNKKRNPSVISVKNIPTAEESFKSFNYMNLKRLTKKHLQLAVKNGTSLWDIDSTNQCIL